MRGSGLAPQPLETNVAAFVGDVRKGPANPAPRWETEPFGMDVSLPAMPRFGGFRLLFARSIKAQDKGPQSLMRAARPQSPAVRGFSGKRKPQSVWRFCKIIAVAHPEKSRVCRALRRF